jgi:16S rRNA (guanine(966)-N(2))-methyltransferase RsmD
MGRIIGGNGRGRRLVAPSGAATRPTGARVRQTLFDVLAPRLPECRFLDLCAGSGGVGLEALSRGAARVVLVERARPALTAIRRNLEAAGDRERVRVVPGDALEAIERLMRAGERFDVIFLDPPYESPLYEELLTQIGETPALEPGGLVVAEHFHKRVLPATIGRLSHTRMVRIGDHRLTFYGVEGPWR